MWGTMGIFVNELTALGIGKMELCFYRSLAAAAAAGLYMLAKDKRLFKIKLKDMWIFIGMGIISFTFFNYCYFTAISESSMSVAAALLYTAPVFVMLLSALLFKERFSVFKGIAVVVTVAGCFLVSGVFSHEGALSAVGIIAGLLSGIGYALYSIFGRFGVERYGTVTVMFYTFASALFATLPFINFGVIETHITAPHTLLLCLAASLITGLIPYFLYTYGLSGVPSGTASVMATVEPAAAAILGITVYHESTEFTKILGIIMILSSVAVLAVGNILKGKHTNEK